MRETSEECHIYLALRLCASQVLTIAIPLWPLGMQIFTLLQHMQQWHAFQSFVL